MSKTVLALDLATQTGWAYGTIGHRCSHGKIRFCKRSNPARAEIFFNSILWLQNKLKTPPDIVVFENPIPFMRGKTNFETLRILYGLAAITEGMAYAHGIFRVTGVNVQSVRYWLLGQRPKKEEAKKLIIQSVTSFGYQPEDDNAADAIALWLYSTKHLLKEVEGG